MADPFLIGEAMTGGYGIATTLQMASLELPT
jgi:hypothetical protein